MTLVEKYRIDFQGKKFNAVGGSSRYEVMIAQWHVGERLTFTIQPFNPSMDNDIRSKVYLEVQSSERLTSDGRYWKLKGILFERDDPIRILQLQPTCSFELFYDTNKRTGDMLLRLDPIAMNGVNVIGDNGLLFSINQNTNEVVSVEYFGRIIHVGDQVVSNGNYLAYDGVAGVVRNINLAGIGAHSQDVLEVEFQTLPSTCAVSFNDLRP